MCWYFKQKEKMSTEPETMRKKNQQPSLADVMTAVAGQLRCENGQTGKQPADIRNL